MVPVRKALQRQLAVEPEKTERCSPQCVDEGSPAEPADCLNPELRLFARDQKRVEVGLCSPANSYCKCGVQESGLRVRVGRDES